MRTIQGYACLASWPEDHKSTPVFYGPPQDTDLEVENVISNGFQLFQTEEEAFNARLIIFRLHEASSVKIYWLDMMIAEGREEWPDLPQRDTLVVLVKPDYGQLLLGFGTEGCIPFGHMGGDFATNGLLGFPSLRHAEYCVEESARCAGSHGEVVSLSFELIEEAVR